MDSDRIDDPDVGQLPALAQPVDRRRADPQPFGYISHAQQPIAPTVQCDEVLSRRRCRDLGRRSRRERGPAFG
jgi:hypothetical protein